MSREFDQIIKEINKQNKDIHNIDNTISKEMMKDIVDVKKTVKIIETKIGNMEKVLDQLFELVNNITIFIDDAEDMVDQDLDDDEEDWTPYDERNFSSYEDNDEEDIGGDDYWSSKQDES